MDKQTIKLEKAEIIAKIKAGDNCEGGYVLAAAPDGSAIRIHWMQTNRQWDPWPQGWEIIGIPALFPDGDGQESEDAVDRLKDFCLLEKAKAIQEEEDISLPEIAERLIPEEWTESKEQSADWLADAFLAACNGNGSDLNRPAPWGTRGEYEQEEIQPPAQFEWAE